MHLFIGIIIVGIIIGLVAALPEPDETDSSIDDFRTFRDSVNKGGK